MSFKSLLAKLLKKDKKARKNGPSKEELLWIELTVPEEIEPVDKKLLAALAGKADPLEAEEALAAFIDCGWERIKKDVYEMAVGKKLCLPGYFERILKAFPEESAKLLELCFADMSNPLKFCYFSALGAKDNDTVVDAVLALLPTLEKEELGGAFSLLGDYPTEKGLAAVAAYLDDADWKIKMKAASALAKAKAFSYIPRISAAAETCDSAVAAGLYEIAGRMEGEAKR